MSTPWRASVLTLYPEMFPGPLGHSLLGKALSDGLWALEATDIRAFSTNRYHSVDDTPAGGGAGMVMRADIVAAALDSIALEGRPLVYLSPRGVPFSQGRARAWASGPGLVLLCGRFEGVDQRVLDQRAIEEVSIGDYVLSGGEIAAMAILDAVVRLIPGVLGQAASLSEESFENGLLEYPHYTRPQIFEGAEIPDVLTSGHHQRIAQWRQAQSQTLTRQRRPDLWARFLASGPKRPAYHSKEG